MAERSAPSADPAEFEEGRYLYCVVAADGERQGDDDGDGAPAFEAEGLDGDPAYLLTEGGVGAVVGRCESMYDAADPSTVRRWLLEHQSVVDAAGEAFGTPIPFRFDTIITGDDGDVRAWLREERETLAGALEELAGHWEYRVEVVRDEDDVEAELAASDDQLRDLAAKRDAADEGRAFLVEKQYERRLRELKRARAGDLEERVREAIAPLVADLRSAERSTAAATLESGDDESDDDGRSTVAARLTLLAPAENEERVGDALAEIADGPGVEVRFTGPWPPYTFAPDLGEEE